MDTSKEIVLGGLTLEEIKKIQSDAKNIQKITDVTNKELKVIIKKQQEILDDIFKDQTNEKPSLITRLNNYRKLAMRGLSMMASSHEVCGIFQRLEDLLKSKGDDCKPYLEDFNRLENIFQANSIINSVPIIGFEIVAGYHIIDYCNNVFPDANITIDKELNKYRTTEKVTRKNALTIISNLIKNGLYFGTEVEVKWIDDKIIVSDNGEGIQDKNKLFTIGNSTRKNGHGVGLFLCKEKALEENCDLYLDVDNTYTKLKGASFVLDLKGQYIKK